MEWLLYAFFALSLASAPLGVAISVLAWRRRHRPGIFSFFCLIAGCSWWSVSSALSMLGPTERIALFWQVPVRMSAVIALPLVAFAFALDYGGHRAWLRPRRFLWLGIIPAISEVINWTPFYPLCIEKFDFVRIGIFFVRQLPTTGAWFPIHAAYSFFLGGGSLLLILLQILGSHGFYRRQAVILFVGVLLVFTTSAFSTLMPVAYHGTTIPWLDWTEVSFAISGIIWSWALFGGHYLDVMPVALDSVFASMEDPVIVLDDKDCIIDLNPAASAILGRSREGAAGQILGGVAPHVAAAFGPTPLAARAEPGKPAEISLSGRVFELRVSSLAIAPGRPAGKLIVLRDVTERVQMMKDLDAYAHTVANDLKNPLSTMTEVAAMIDSSHAVLDDESRGFVSSLGETGKKMSAIISELLLLANVRSAAEVGTAPLDMARIVESARKRLIHQIQSTGAELVLPPDWPPARGYEAWVEEVWANYLSNALKYGGSPPQAVMGATADADVVRFWVRDNGPGLSAEAAAGLFREFSRLDPQRAEGHGLGLSIVSRIVKKLGGEVGVDSQPGAGCTFWFTLPAA